MLLLHRFDDGEDVLSRADHDDAADGFALPVPVHHAAAHLGPKWTDATSDR